MSKFQKEKLNEQEIMRDYLQRKAIKSNRLANKNLVLENMKYDSLIQEQEQELENKQNINEMANKLGISRTKSRAFIMTEKTRLTNKLTKELFVESVFDIFYDALVLDEDFKETYRGNLYNLTESTINSYMEANNKTIDDIQNESCQAMALILETCKKAAKETAEQCVDSDDKKSRSVLLSEKRKKAQDQETIRIDDGIKSDFENDKSFHTKNIATLVQNKVVQVIDSEHKASEEEEKYFETLEEKVQRNEAPADEELIAEMDSEVDDEDDEMLDEAPKADGEVSDKEFTSADERSNQKKNKDLKLAETMRMYRKEKKKINENTLFKSLMISISKNNLNQMKNEGSEMELDMNMVFAEAICHYTLLETLYTTNILNLSHKEIKSFVTDMMIR